MRILITSVGSATSVNLIKYFRKLGDFIVGTDVNQYGYTSGSTLVDQYIQVPFADHQDYISFVTKIIHEFHIDLFIPVHDDEVVKVSEFKEKLGCHCLIADCKTIRLLQDKLSCSKFMESFNILVPPIYTDDNVNQERILRKRISVGSKEIFYFHKNDRTINYQPDEYFLQQKICGDEYTVDVLADDKGHPVYIIPRKRIEVKSGVATKVRIEEDVILIHIVKRILECVVLPGFSNIQFIKDKNGNFWFIEINFRFSGCGAASLAVAQDYLKCFKSLAFGEEVSEKLNHDVRWNCIVTRYYEEVVYEESIS